ncbi:sucrose-specific PTS transporter subunit IIBC [Bacillus sp. 03113]|uniref:sucrose-specific PTS transporter subunit IIBC n=1 Tax=Bacillus sp. 03113 TaxID=2578211 RepID=UPI001143CDD5|nr:sucrose-specific PTS transporter subunit IIBC [Bacillus sp. 03113]
MAKDNQNFEAVAKQIVALVGDDNIISATHCQTRLRFVVKDREKIDDKKLENVNLVKGVFFNGGQYQVIIGTGLVHEVYKEIEKIGIKSVSKEEQKAFIKENETGLKKVMRILSEIFIPIVPVIAATGLFLGVKGALFNDNVLALFGAKSTDIPLALQQVISVLTDTAFAFLPALIVWSTFRVFHGTPVIGIVIGLMMVSPILPNAYAVADPKSGVEALKAFGFIPIVGSQGSVLSAIVAGIIGAKLEHFFRKMMPNVLDQILTPFMTMLTTFLIIILGVGPVLHWVELGMVGGIKALIDLPLGIGGFIIGATYPLMVLIGIHHTLVMIETSLLANTGFNALITLCAMYGFANMGSCLAFTLRAKSEKAKSTAIGAMMSQSFGVSEPVLFGVLIRYNLRPLIIVLLSSGFGAALLSIFHIRSNSYGLAVIPSYLMYIYSSHQLIFYAIISVISFVLCFVLTSLFAIPKEILKKDENDVEEILVKKRETVEDENLSFPVSGKVIELADVVDPVFSSGMMGKGTAVIPIEGNIYSPADGKLSVVADTGHAYGLKTEKGAEVLLHIGIDTVSLEGKGFSTKVTAGQTVKKGDLLGTFDIEAIKGAGLDHTVMIIVTNSQEFSDVVAADTTEAKVGELALFVEREKKEYKEIGETALN